MQVYNNITLNYKPAQSPNAWLCNTINKKVALP